MEKTARGNVLIIDDELGPRESIRIVLGEEHNCIVAEGGEGGLALMDENPVDVVILDIKMPGVDGIETLARIKEKKPDVMVVLLTGYGTLETAQKAIRLGAFDYLKKPFDIGELRDVVRKGLMRKCERLAEKAHLDDLEVLIGKMKEEMADFDRMSNLGTLSAGIVHEMKNPLTVILGYTQMILSGVKRGTSEEELTLSEKSLDYLSVIERETMHCAEIARKLLAISKGSKETFSRVDVKQVVRDIEVLIQPQCSVSQIRIGTESPAEELCSNIVQSNVHDILLNLCFNSIHAMEKGGKIVIRSLATDRSGNSLSEITDEEREYLDRQSGGKFVAVEVQDSGSGISDEDREKIFEPFFTTKEGESGTGLGLPLSREKAEKNSGNLSLVRTGPEGTIFRLLLPMA